MVFGKTAHSLRLFRSIDVGRQQHPDAVPTTTREPSRSRRRSGEVMRGRTISNVGVSLGYLLVLVDSTVLNVALPDIARSLGGSVAGQQWVVSAYLVTFGALLLSSGAIADRYGALRTYRVGVFLFVLTSVLCALAPTLLILIVLRAFQGAAAALIPGTTLALIGRMNPEPADRHRAIGLYALVTGCGFAAGPTVGGILVAAGGWRWIFLINVPVGILALAWSRYFPADPKARDRGARLDVRGQVLAVVFFALVVVVIIETGERSPIAAWALIPTVCAAGLLYWSDRRSAAPAIPVRLLRIPPILRGTLYGFTIQVVMASTLFVASLYLINARGLSPLGAGLVLIAYTFGPCVLGPVVGRVVAARGPQLPALLGQSAAVVGSVAIAAVMFVGGPLWALIATMLIAGAALPLVIVPITGLVVAGAPAGSAGTAGGLFSASRQLGGAFGVAALGAVLASVGGADGAAWAMMAAAVVAAIALLGMVVRPHRVR